ncbi:MAG: SbcC/MukB-like Walker B domain-containing protein, partial [Sedimenticola sp.]
MSGGHGRFDKQDQRRLNEGWMTGFDNLDRLRELELELEQIKQEVEQKGGEFARAKAEHQAHEQQLQLLSMLDGLEFNSIDTAAVESRLTALRQQLEQLQDPDSDAGRAKERWDESKAVLAACRRELQESEVKRGLLEAGVKRAEHRIKDFFRRMGSGLSTKQQALGDQRFKVLQMKEIEQLEERERQAAVLLQQQSSGATSALSTSEKRLVRLMGQAKQKDTGALAEAGTEIQDIPNYLQQLEQLTREALPEKVERFLDYLNKSSDEGVTQLLANIDNQVSIIEERIEELNLTMVKVDFQSGRYLHLQPRRVIHETLTSIQRAQRELRSASLKEDQGESHFRALVELVRQLRDAVERKKTVGARALLDPRYRLQFTVSVIEREGERVVEVRTGSQGGSGGEKEIIASYILTASLSYALCPEGVGRPLFGTVVLDEAFSKSSQVVAARIIEALRQFGLHPLFITPNKEMRLLRCHTRSAVLVHRRGPFATTTSLSWEELDRHARKRLERE